MSCISLKKEVQVTKSISSQGRAYPKMGLTTAKKGNGKKVREIQDDEETEYLYERIRLDETIDRHLDGSRNDNPYFSDEFN